MTHYPKRLIEVDLPIKKISAHARREKSIRHGHISTLHIWWARRPLAACRAVLCASLWPDPAPGPDDPPCPQTFVNDARRIMHEFWDPMDLGGRDLDDPLELRCALLDFMADFANWDHSTDGRYLEAARALTQSAHESLGGVPDTRPLVIDPFAGGGAIPLEALRVGADAFASDLNPVAVLLNKVVLEYIPKYGPDPGRRGSALGHLDQRGGRTGACRVIPQGPRRGHAHSLPLGKNGHLRGSGVRRRSSIDALDVARQKEEPPGGAQDGPGRSARRGWMQ